MKSYAYSAEYNGNDLFNQANATSVYGTKYTTDNGVFVVDSYNSTSHGTINTAGPFRASTLPPSKESFGSTNMCTSTAYGMCFMKVNSGMSGYRRFSTVDFSITKGIKGTSSTEAYTIPDITVFQTGSARIDKVEVVEQIKYTETGMEPRTGEIVYASGWTIRSFNEDGSLLENRSLIFTRCITSDKPTLLYSYGVPRCENSSLVFSSDGSKLYSLKGNNGTPLSEVVSTAFSNDIAAANDGMLAVSCMATLDGNAAWLSHKNGIYKLYQGATPLNGMPGEKITIKGHEFVCLAYGPFYARMS